MNLLTDSLASCCTHVHAQCCDMPMRLVLTADQDVLLLPRAAAIDEGSISIAVNPGVDRMAVLLLLQQLFNMLMMRLQFQLTPRGRPSAGAR